MRETWYLIIHIFFLFCKRSCLHFEIFRIPSLILSFVLYDFTHAWHVHVNLSAQKWKTLFNKKSQNQNRVNTNYLQHFLPYCSLIMHRNMYDYLLYQPVNTGQPQPSLNQPDTCMTQIFQLFQEVDWWSNTFDNCSAFLKIQIIQWESSWIQRTWTDA